MDAQNSQHQRRKPNGRGPGRPFRKGQSGNPGGRPKELKHVQELARRYTDEAIKTLAEIMRNSNEPARARAAAAEALLDRGWGKALQHLEGNVKHNHAWTEIPASLRKRVAAACGMAEDECVTKRSGIVRG